MGRSVPLPPPTGPVATSWLISCLLHAMLAMAALFFVRHLQLAPQAEPFRWDIAMVAPLSSLGQSTPTTQPIAPPTPAIQPPGPPSKTTYPVKRSGEPVRTGSDASVATTSSPQPSQKHLPQSESSLSATIPALSTDSLPTVTPQNLPSTLSEQSTLPHDESPATTDSQPRVESALNPSSPTIASISSPDHFKSAKVDYGWLAAIMAQWIEDLNKRYPAMLRTEGAQGKVTLAATLHENGLLSDVRVVKSSGYTALDQVAVEDVQNGPPIHFVHPLDRAQIPVKFSISYDLETAR